MAQGSSARRREPVRHGARALAAASLALAIHACAPPPVTPPAPPGAARPRAGYDARVDDLAAVDTTALAGRRIALDPGHGGRFRGSLGVNGLTEAEVNLGVALYLRGLLEGAGAEVFMTRTTDRDFLTPADSALRADLAARIDLANASGPDLFVSIHHNADAGGAHDVNETQTYYKLGDEGPSLDAAQRVHRYLVRNLGIERHRIVPGNYFVLRNSTAPALLTESSYITNPDVEAKLALASKQRLEAEALYLGIARYFARGAPRVESFAAYPPRGGPADTAFADVEAPVLRARIAGAFDGWSLTLDGTPLDGVRRGADLEWRPARLEGGRHEAVLRVRLAGHGAARDRRLAFTLERKPAAVVPSTFSPPIGREGGVAAIRFEVRDDADAVYRDSTVVRVHAMTAGITPADTLLGAREGAAWGYFRITRGTAPARMQARAGDRPAGGDIEADARVWPLADRGARADSSRWAGFLRVVPGDSVLRDAPPLAHSRATRAWLNRDGFAVLARDAAGRPVVPALPGYRTVADSSSSPHLVAIAGGTLHGRRIVVDPDGGGDQAGGTGPSGTRAAHVNLEVARALAAMLESAGAEVLLTRTGDFAISDVERVEKSEAFGAERYLRIGHRAEPPRLGHYFASAAGKRWAERTREALAQAGFSVPAPVADAQYPLQQTSCPALYAAPARIDDRAQEERLAAPGTVRAEAYALALALAGEWSDAAWPADSIEVRDARDVPVSGAVVTLGGALVLETDAFGRIRFARTEPGPMEVEVARGGSSSRTVLLDSSRGVRVGLPDAP